jgi:hypothetical protein
VSLISFITGTQSEVLFAGPVSNYAAAAASSASAQNLMVGATGDYVQPYLPAFFWQMGRQNQCIHATFWGIMTGQSSATTATLTAQLCTASNTATAGTGGGTLVASTVITMTSISNQPWQFDVYTLARGVGYGTTSTSTNLVSFGNILINAATAPISGVSGPTSLLTIDASATWWYNLTVTFSTSSTTNSCTLEQIFLRGLN